MRPSPSVVADVNELNQRLAGNFKLGREEAGLTQKELGRLSGVRRNEMNAYENGRRPITHNMVVRVAGALHRDPSWFYVPHDAEDTE